MPVAADTQRGEALQKRIGGGLPVVPGQHHAAHEQAQAPEDVDQAEDVVVIGDAQVAPDLVLLNVRRVDGNDDLHILLKLLEHPDLAVRLEARQDPGGMVVVEQLAAEFQVQLAAELGNPLFDLFGLGGEVFLIVKANGCHMYLPLFAGLSNTCSISYPPGFGKTVFDTNRSRLTPLCPGAIMGSTQAGRNTARRQVLPPEGDRYA